MQLVAEKPATDTIRAKLNYIIDTGTPPVTYVDWPEMARDANPPTYEMHEVTIRNGRPLRDTFQLDTHGFAFVDRLPESGITFRHRATPESTVDFKLVHYDHGTGLAVADVDGDQLPDLYFVNQAGANELWRNLGGGRFEDGTARAGVSVCRPMNASRRRLPSRSVSMDVAYERRMNPGASNASPGV